MKKIKKIFILLSILLILSNTDNKDRVIKVKTPTYTVIYSEYLEQPKEVWYNVKCINGDQSRKGMDFYTNDTIHTSDDKDYRNNDWDKGHIAPAADFSCDKEDLKNTFSYLNCSLQHKDLNRGVWKYLESHERKLAESKSITIKIHVLIMFNDKCKKLKTGATVPYGFRKEISYGNNMEIYFFKNEKPVSDNYTYFRISR